MKHRDLDAPSMELALKSIRYLSKRARMAHNQKDNEQVAVELKTISRLARWALGLSGRDLDVTLLSLKEKKPDQDNDKSRYS